MIKSSKEQLSEYVESIFKRYKEPGLHICDLATGGGKSYTIGKLTCEYYPKYFDRIVILCVQKKLVEGMKTEIDRFLSSSKSELQEKDIIVVKNNIDVIKEAVRNGKLRELVEELKGLEFTIEGRNKNAIRSIVEEIEKMVSFLSNLVKFLPEKESKDDMSSTYINSQIEDEERKLRRAIRNIIELYKNAYKHKKKYLETNTLLKKIPTLSKVYPQVLMPYKKVILMTIQKAMCGTDPILSDEIYLWNLKEDKKKTLIFFDESDQAAVAMRDAIIRRTINQSNSQRKFGKGYSGFQEYRTLLFSSGQVSGDYYQGKLENALKKVKSKTEVIWRKTMGNVEPYRNIIPSRKEELEEYRRGVFFCGPIFQVNIHKEGSKEESFICHEHGKKHLTLVHSEDMSEIEQKYEKVVPLGEFLSTIFKCTTQTKATLGSLANEALQRSRKEFNKQTETQPANGQNYRNYLGYPTLQRELHTLMSRFETSSEQLFEQQIEDFMTNRTHLISYENNQLEKFSDNSIYTHGFRFYQEELDDYDNEHRVKLVSREIATTPEKIIQDLVKVPDTSVVLCSATASSESVISNFDIEYLKDTLSGKVHTLKDDYPLFDRLSEATYPKGHQIMIKSIQAFEDENLNIERVNLPERLRLMFCQSAQEDGSVDKWFKYTKRELLQRQKSSASYYLGRLLQFVEVYHFFIKSPTIHSMLYFQNQSGNSYAAQLNIISSLIDGSYTDQPSTIDDELPKDWYNEHISYSKDMTSVKKEVLAPLSADKDKKIMLVSAYNTFKAGANLQYDIPEDADCIYGDNWINAGTIMKKDWDAIYLQKPTHYLSLTADPNEKDYEQSLYKIMLNLMMLYERGCLSTNEVRQEMYDALVGRLFFKANEYTACSNDRSAWAQAIIEQAIGRLCRTRNKTGVTYILYDENLKEFYMNAHIEKSLTKEYRTFLQEISSGRETVRKEISPEERQKINIVRIARKNRNSMLRQALKYTPKPVIDYEEQDLEEEISQNVLISQKMNERFKRTIITKPVINSLEELNEEDHKVGFISKCYGKWKRNPSGGYDYYREGNDICCGNKGKKTTISPSSVRLDAMMRNNTIRLYFQSHGFATEWGAGELILHPDILLSEYAGEIGEQAFKALVINYAGCTEEELCHLERQDYELADFVIKDQQERNRIAFDVKNYDPEALHQDQTGDLTTTQKRRLKEERLGCRLVTVNILEINRPGIDAQHEIYGLIRENGEIIQENLQQVIRLIKQN